MIDKRIYDHLVTEAFKSIKLEGDLVKEHHGRVEEYIDSVTSTPREKIEYMAEYHGIFIEIGGGHFRSR